MARGVKKRKAPDMVAELLIHEHGVENALKTVTRERDSARRSRSRVRFNYWIAIAQEINSRANAPASLNP